jgi:hypothetical protein
MVSAMSPIDEGYVQRNREAKAVREHGGSIVVDRVEVLGASRSPGADPPTIYQPKEGCHACCG